ncbi:MAG: hypothetical protein GY711_22705 [bacterium]|nr:hypothetical protein [bacterium]
MAFKIRRVHYYSLSVPEEPSEACSLLNQFSELGVNMLAFSAVPVGPTRTQLSLFPEDNGKLESFSRHAGIHLDGPHGALIVQGDDEMGALAKVHVELQRAGVQVYASSGVSDGRGGYGYVIYVRAADQDKAAAALGI